MKSILESGFSSLGLTLRDGAVSDFISFSTLLAERNRVMNLTAITAPEEIARLHLLDSCALLGLYDFGGKSVIDVGTGAGFPGLPLRIAEPEIRLTLLDSLAKRVDFLDEACRQLGYDEVSCVHSRAEELPEGFRESFDIAVSRAVARLNVLLELCLPYVSVGGVFIAMKGPEPREELDEAAAAISELGGELERVCGYNIPGTDIFHSAIIVRKVQNTPLKYPRRFAKLQKSPL